MDWGLNLLTVLFIPLFLMLSSVHLTDTPLGIILVYTAFGFPLAVMLATQFMEGLPNSLVESAYMAGASAAWSGSEGLEIDFEKNLNGHYFHDKTGKASEALLKMANLYKDFSNKMHNMSIFAAVMFGPSYAGYQEEYKKFPNIDFSSAYLIIDQVDSLKYFEKLDNEFLKH